MASDSNLSLRQLPQALTVFLELLIVLQNPALVDEPLFLRRDADRGSNMLLKFLYIHLKGQSCVGIRKPKEEERGTPDFRC